MLGSQNPQKRVAHAQSCGDNENKLEARKRWERQVEGVQGHLLHVVPPKKLHRQLRNLGWRSIKGTKIHKKKMKRSNWWGTEHADKDGEGSGGWGGIGVRQSNKQ